MKKTKQKSQVGKYTIFGLIGAFTLLATYSLVRSKMADDTVASYTTIAPQPTPNTKTFTMTQIATHTTAGDCIMAIDGKAYDITKYISGLIHPGGDNMTPYCGKDASDVFGGTLKGKRSHAHTAAARVILSNYLVGTVK